VQQPVLPLLGIVDWPFDAPFCVVNIPDGFVQTQSAVCMCVWQQGQLEAFGQRLVCFVN
jgi:hypothetical protein